MPDLPPIGSRLTLAQLDDAVHAVQLAALAGGYIPISTAISRKGPDGRHELLALGHNHLAAGIPGVHGETGALIDLGTRLGRSGADTDFSELVATSSLSPCEFCQRTLARHLGIGSVRILDAVNYTPDFASYPAGLTPEVANHPGVVETFRTWVTDPRNATLWDRDIGLYPDVPLPPPVGPEAARFASAVELAHRQAALAAAENEAPVGAVILDPAGLVIGAGCSQVLARHDPTLVAAMSAWRAAGAREHWKDKTLLLTAGPDHIAYSMFKVFNFGRLVVASEAVFAGTLAEVRSLMSARHGGYRGGDGSEARVGDGRVTVLGDGRSDALLAGWLGRASPRERARYFGVR